MSERNRRAGQPAPPGARASDAGRSGDKRSHDQAGKRGEHRPKAAPMPIDAVRQAAERAAARHGSEILEASLHPGGRARFVIDRDGAPVDADLLVLVLRALHAELKEAGLDPGDYDLEVESPGSTRPLRTPRHLERFKGHRVRVRLTTPLDGRPTLAGQLVGPDGDGLVLQADDGRTYRLASDAIAQVHLAGG